MKALLIDTCTEYGTVAIFDNDNILFEGDIPPGLNNSKYIVPEIARGLESLNLKIETLDYIAVTIGPGSYTGIRVGVAVAKTLAYTQNLPIVALYSLEAFIPDKDGSFAALIDAKIGGVYALFGTLKHGEVSYTSEPKALTLEELGPHLEKLQTVVTPNSTPLKQKIETLYPPLKLEWIESKPNLPNLVKLSNKKYKSKQVTDCNHLKIEYLRKTQAEIEKESKK